ncbi:Dethiobiotin synthetase [Planktothrix sp. FACHB-1365]|uniref:Dethiobiotin synthetase n=1 Tax=Planktothrix sp. FACHB-1365 TaxID=2692855 RepID=UPI0016896CA0|nr:Dethiobiotin synthetase [Planktothrix sp. FACHB-1365]MBD2485750.1 Dethiobiotin synthetase [Planktothrix sp. FACHB-1365]
MDYKTAYSFLIDQGMALETQKNPDAFLMRLKQGQPPIPGQVTAILLALKIAYDTLKETSTFEKNFVLALHELAMQSHQQFASGRNRGVEWPPLLQEDLHRIALGVKSIFSGYWLVEK